MFIASSVAMVVLAVLFWAAYPKTKYAAGYSEAAFTQVNTNMTADEVRKILGEPLSNSSPATSSGRVFWRYTADLHGGPLDVGWHFRLIVSRMTQSSVSIRSSYSFLHGARKRRIGSDRGELEDGNGSFCVLDLHATPIGLMARYGKDQQPPYVGYYDC
jgi:hypothetical protein